MADTTTKPRDRSTVKPPGMSGLADRDKRPAETKAPAVLATATPAPETTGTSATPAAPERHSLSWPRSQTAGSGGDDPRGAQPGTGMPQRQPVIAPAPSFGPTGKHRSVAAVVILSIVTLGVYGLLWYQRINVEMGDFDPRMHVRPARSTLAVVFAWLLGVLITVAGAARIILALLGVNLSFDPGFTVLQAYGLLGGILVIPYIELLLPVSVVAIVMTLERVRIVEDRVGRTTDVQLRPARSVCWLLMPIIGGLILQASVQRRLNRVWDLSSAPVLAGRLSRL
jgi:hypothetical protein